MPSRIEIETRGFAKAIETLSNVKPRFIAAAERSARAVGERALELIQRYYRGAGETAPDRTARRTGRLANSYDVQTGQDQEAALMRIGAIRPGLSAQVLAYAALQEYGGVIAPKRAQFLTIPTDEAKTPAGVPRGRARSFPNTHIRIYPGGTRGGIYQKNPGEMRARKLFHLTRDPVRVPGRPSLRPVEPLIVRELTRRNTEDFRNAMIGEA